MFLHIEAILCVECVFYCMSRVGVVSDIHGNAPAFEAVLDALAGEVDYIVCLGDIIGICGFPSEVISMVRENCKFVISGNHDMYPFEGDLEPEVASVEQKLFEDKTTQEQQSWLYKLPFMTEVDSDELLLAHSYPISGRASGFQSGNSGVKPREMIEVGSEFEDKILLLGHVHEQHSVNLEKFGHNVVVVNPGSVGGFYQDVAEYAIVDTESRDVELLSVEYDEARVLERVKEMESEYGVSLLK